MGKYIDADALKKQMLKYGFHSVDQTVTEFVYDTLPTADVVEVVRCKDCKFWQTDWLTSHDGYHYCEMVDIVIDGDFYCSYGERKILPKL